ncbi:MAG TPA: hypothetical protein VMI35_04900 [Puia sp.]|nr:hypothetical protein [Puia sp.]
MEQEKTMSGEEGLRLIERMIFVAKQEQRVDGVGWIWWGWALFAASIFTLVNLRFNWVSTYFFWNALGVVALVYFVARYLQYFFFGAGKTVRTYTCELIRKLNLGFFISLFFIMIAMNGILSPMAGFPILVNLYAFWILIYGTSMNFRPFIAGAFVAWGLGIAGLFAKTFEGVMLTHAIAVLCGYIIPGYMANTAFKKLNREVAAYSV